MRNKIEKAGMVFVFFGLYSGTINSVKGDDIIVPTIILAIGLTMYFLAE